MKANINAALSLLEKNGDPSKWLEAKILLECDIPEVANKAEEYLRHVLPLIKDPVIHDKIDRKLHLFKNIVAEKILWKGLKNGIILIYEI